MISTSEDKLVKIWNISGQKKVNYNFKSNH